MTVPHSGIGTGSQSTTSSVPLVSIWCRISSADIEYDLSNHPDALATAIPDVDFICQAEGILAVLDYLFREKLTTWMKTY
jgi:hypothetical protein